MLWTPVYSSLKLPVVAPFWFKVDQPRDEEGEIIFLEMQQNLWLSQFLPPQGICAQSLLPNIKDEEEEEEEEEEESYDEEDEQEFSGEVEEEDEEYVSQEDEDAYAEYDDGFEEEDDVDGHSEENNEDDSEGSLQNSFSNPSIGL